MATPITNYSSLVEAVKETTEFESTELTNYLPLAIANAEEKLFRELELPALEAEETGSLTMSSQVISKPSNYRISDFLMIKVDGKWTPLKKKFASFLYDYWPDTTITGIPKYYADKSDTQLMVAPTPNSGYTYMFRCIQKPTIISTSNATNYFTENCPNILFFATMIEISRFMKSWSQIPVWENSYRQAQEAWNLEQMRYRRDGQATPNSPDDGPNSLKHTINTQS